MENQLDSFEPAGRKQALLALKERAERGEIVLPAAGSDVNLHAHTFFSYNAYGYSPTRIAWLGRKAGWAVAGIVDFDVLDGVDEFLETSRALGLKACAGMETRVFIPEFADAVINSPGEPGIAYHMGIGIPRAQLDRAQAGFLRNLRQIAQDRNQALLERVNAFLAPVTLNYELEVQSLTPSGNATERHICLAYVRKAHRLFLDTTELAAFWSGKLGMDATSLDLPDGIGLQSQIRSTTMKRGGVGYVAPDPASFPTMAETNRFILAAGGIPTVAWLDGTSDGEARIGELLELAMSTGVAAINIIPDRNYRPGVDDQKLANLREVIALAQTLHLPVVVGTEMNSPGQKQVDDFASRELSPFVPVFLQGAHIVYAHSLLQQHGGLGYTSDWAQRHFPTTEVRNAFFEEVGRRMSPTQEARLAHLTADVTPEAILSRIS